MARDYRAEYERRKERAAQRGSTFYRQRVERDVARGLTPSQAGGHPREGEAPASAVTGHGFAETSLFTREAGDIVTLPDATAAEATRVARYLRITRSLQHGTITPAEFQRRVSRWEPIRGQHFLADPQRVLALQQTLDRDEILFRYLRRVA